MTHTHTHTNTLLPLLPPTRASGRQGSLPVQPSGPQSGLAVPPAALFHSLHLTVTYKLTRVTSQHKQQVTDVNNFCSTATCNHVVCLFV